MIKLNQKVEFDPFAGIHLAGIVNDHEIVTGTVRYINKQHHWFSVEYGDEGAQRRISFKFDDIGKTVKVMEG